MGTAKARIALFTGIAALVAALAACGGGGSGGGGGGGGGGTPPTSQPTNPPTTSPPSTGITGTVSANGSALANANVVYTCGCSAQAGTTTADGGGNFTIATSATAVPPSPNPTYTIVPGRNYMVIGANATTHQEAWTIVFLGSQSSHNLYLGTGSADTTDNATAAAALYVFLNAQNESDTAFDDWNFNTIAAWTSKLRSSPTSQETKLMSDISAAEASATPLYPTIPDWDNDRGSANATIAADVRAITPANDSSVPTPCPLSGGTPACTGAPTP